MSLWGPLSQAYEEKPQEGDPKHCTRLSGPSQYSCHGYRDQEEAKQYWHHEAILC
jgi:hypothetical protein